MKVIYCPVCELAPREGAVVCDGCEHPLDQPFVKANAPQQLSERFSELLAAAALNVAMLIANVLLFGGAGYIVSVGLMAWLASSWVPYHGLKKKLAREA